MVHVPRWIFAVVSHQGKTTLGFETLKNFMCAAWRGSGAKYFFQQLLLQLLAATVNYCKYHGYYLY